MTRTTGRGALLTPLVLLIAALAMVATVIGLLSTPDPTTTVQTVRGTEAVLYGGGVYEYDTLFTGAGNRGTDAVTLLIGIPLLLAATWRWRRGSLRWALVLTGAVGWFLYVYATLAVNAAFNALFLVYVVLFSASLYTFILTIVHAGRLELRPRPDRELPRRVTAVFMIVTGVMTGAVWIVPVLAAQLAGQVPERLDTYTTFVTVALDAGVIVPAVLLSGILIWRGSTIGYVYAVPLLMIAAGLAPAMTAQTVSQVSAGVEFTTSEVVGIIGSFAAISLAALVVLVRLLLSLHDPARDD